MRAMAPPTKPTEQKRRIGTLRKDRLPSGADLIPVDPAPAMTEPPATLGELGRHEWRHALATCQWLARSDLTALRLMCEALDRRAGYSRLLDGGDLMLETSTGYAYLNPAITGLRQSEEAALKWMSLLGLTPSDRARLGVAEVQAMSTLDKLAAAVKARNVGKAPPLEARGADGSLETTPLSPRSRSRRATGTSSQPSSRSTAASPRTRSQVRVVTPSIPEGGSED